MLDVVRSPWMRPPSWSRAMATPTHAATCRHTPAGHKSTPQPQNLIATPSLSCITALDICPGLPSASETYSQTHPLACITGLHWTFAREQTGAQGPTSIGPDTGVQHLNRKQRRKLSSASCLVHSNPTRRSKVGREWCSGHERAQSQGERVERGYTSCSLKVPQWSIWSF